MQDVSSEFVFTSEALSCLERIGGMLLLLRGKVRTDADMMQDIDETLEGLNEIQSAIAAQMEVNANA